ncbi:hypothetical protein RGQ29_010251 [Quercus rubra]|uniref:Uncharacterized protein n=1 Tax=Quercus rubra TaxID=3512 RepID=A0AAN7FXR9_QUERU|nr:hypothetical protein RGQ29_010251 [Quercus rubra]
MMDPPNSILSNHPWMTIESLMEAKESKIESDGDSHFVCWNWSSVGYNLLLLEKVLIT